MNVLGNTDRTAHDDAVDWRGRRLLLVEDNEDHQYLTEAVLSATGVEVVIVDCGEDAIHAVTSSITGDAAFDVVLMDIRLPTIDGYETTRRLRQLGYDRPIVALTARAMDAELTQCHDAGCNACVSKPFDQRLLRATIDDLLMPVTTGP